MSHKSFYLIKRRDRLINGKPIYYVRFRDPAGQLLKWQSTEETNKARAEAWAISRLKSVAKSIPQKLTFSGFAEKWWIWEECSYIRRKLARGKRMSRTHADIQRSNLERDILPTFGGMSRAEFEEKIPVAQKCPRHRGNSILPIS